MMAGLPKRLFTFGFVLVGVLLTLVSGASLVFSSETSPTPDDSKTQVVKVTIPEVMRISVNTTELSFDLGREAEGQPFPPESYPAYYYPTSSPDGAVDLRVHSNGGRDWVVYVKPSGDLSDGTNVIPISRLEWSIDRMTWTSFSNGGEFGVPVLSGTRLTGWKDFKVYYRLKLVGDEMGGTTYKTTLKYTILAP